LQDGVWMSPSLYHGPCTFPSLSVAVMCSVLKRCSKSQHQDLLQLMRLDHYVADILNVLVMQSVRKNRWRAIAN
jgi:hypothetical protein